MRRCDVRRPRPATRAEDVGQLEDSHLHNGGGACLASAEGDVTAEHFRVAALAVGEPRSVGHDRLNRNDPRRRLADAQELGDGCVDAGWGTWPRRASPIPTDQPSTDTGRRPVLLARTASIGSKSSAGSGLIVSLVRGPVKRSPALAQPARSSTFTRPPLRIWLAIAQASEAAPVTAPKTAIPSVRRSTPKTVRARCDTRTTTVALRGAKGVR